MPLKVQPSENSLSSSQQVKNPGFALVLALLLLAGLVMGALGAMPTGDAVANIKGSNEKTLRVLITPRSQAGHIHLRNHPSIKIKHDWKGRFTAEVPEDALPTLLLDADIQPVELLDLHEVAGHNNYGINEKRNHRSVCGDSVCQGFEKWTCPKDCIGRPIPPGKIVNPWGPSTNPTPPQSPVKPSPLPATPIITPIQPSSPIRSCFPSVQREYNVLQVGGGQSGAGAGVNVAVLDTGTTSSHLDLASNIKVCVDTTDVGVQNTCQDTDSSGHGTHTTGIVAANGGADGQGMFGVAPGANIFAVKVCASGCYADDIAEGIDYAAHAGAHIISMSFGTAAESQLIKDAILRHPDVLFIASAGNAGPAQNTINFPAAHTAVIAVSANDQNKAVVWFSSRGITDGNDNSISAREVELSAGGLNIEAPNKDGCYSRLSGTSFSAPVIAGLAANVWDQADGIIDGKGDAGSVRRFLLSKAQDITVADGGGAGPGYDISSGYGLPVVS